MVPVLESGGEASSLPGASSVEGTEDRAQPAVGLTEADCAAIFERHAAEILRYAIRCAGRREVAEELASEAFLKMYQHRDRIEGHRAAAWLTTTVKNLATDYWRRSVVEQRHTPRPEPAPEMPPLQTWQELIRDPALKAEHRACLTLHYVHGMERKEITSQTGLTDNQVKSCLQYGLKLLRKAMGVKP